jgi:two-component system, cell cycle sensor histidine kinase and response regulator CckA
MKVFPFLHPRRRSRAAPHGARRSPGASLWLPLSVALLGVVASLLFSRALRRTEHEAITRLAETHVRLASRHLETTLDEYLQTLAGIAPPGRGLGPEGRLPIGMKGVKAVLWCDSPDTATWLAPREGRTPASVHPSDLGIDGGALQAALRDTRASITPSAVSPDGESSFEMLVPARPGDRPAGVLVAIFSTSTFYSAVLEADAASGWALTVLEEGQESYRNGSAAEDRWLAASSVTMLGTERRVRMGLTPGLMAHARSSLPTVVLATGSVIALLFAAALGLAQRARHRAQAAEAAEAAQRKSEEQYRLLFESNPEPMWVYDERSVDILAVNEAAIRNYGYSREEFLTMTLRDVRPAEEIPVLDAQIAKRLGERNRVTFRSPRVWKHRKKDGTLIDVEVTASPIEFHGRLAWLALISDVTEKKQLEAQFLLAQKMEATGRLAGGIAHDFNNLLSVITGYGDLLLMRLPVIDPRREKVEQIVKAARSAADLARRLLAFSRKQVLQPRVLDLNTLVRDMDGMLRRLVGEDIRFSATLAHDLGSVKADPGQMEQVLVNLVLNARDAMPRGGHLVIETGNVTFDAAYARLRPGLEPGPYAMLAVSDTGHGMPPTVLEHLFEPFFTTKERGKGTGLGLATVHGIVKQSGGHIFVYSEPGGGAAFKIYLPRLAEAAERESPLPVTAELPRGSETVLLVEDEAALRNLVRECLETSGYTVVEARHGGEALEIAERHRFPLHLLMTDVVMPGMSGRELAERLASRRAELRVLYMSGYTDDAVIRHGVLSQQMAFLQKPFTAEALARKVREVLDARVEAGGPST